MFLAVCTVLFAIVTQVTNFHLAIQYTILGIVICSVFIIPQGIVLGVTGTTIYLNVLAQVLIGFIIPGNTISVMAFKSLVTNNGIQATLLIKDLKIGHYMKV